ncbi:hypothetical protein CWATWH8502_2248 [Crocosphaera watsonii WH 8502]|uniref:Uncharacterized protein n=1 Tax=Crocosphaera watsonii WH 8502 TaxID=423474 RepID=T2IM23_CROWT|nr:hypothetical protein CWATWH8502_2248 [Crocosphaera watsonii WH 8502]
MLYPNASINVGIAFSWQLKAKDRTAMSNPTAESAFCTASIKP